MKIKTDKADKVFSQVIRLRDRKCVRCGSPVKFNDKGLPVSHQNSHYFGRGRESTRFHLYNCDTLCYGCHRIWGSDDKEGYRAFKIKQLGEDGFNLLTILANTTVKKDRKMAFIVANELLNKSMEG